MPLSSPIEPFNMVGTPEADIVEEIILHDKPLSGYLAGRPRGGHYVRKLEDAWAERFGVRHAIACNSATSGLLAASMVCAPTWGHDDIAVPCFTMSATAAAPLIASPDNQLLFLDCDPLTYCSTPALCPQSHIGLIIVTNLFGQAAPLTQWRELADELEVFLIEDAAQSPFALTSDDRLAGTVGDIGVFSLNVHKHLQVGEGGIMVTNNDALAEELRGFINHGEALNQKPGLNLRMTEIAAAMAICQLNKADWIIQDRIDLAHELSDMVKDFWVPPVEEGRHVFYHWAVRVPNRDAVCNFLRNEGIPVRNGYVKPLYHIPSFDCMDVAPCPVAEKAHKELMIFEICSWNPTIQQREEMREIFKRASELSNMGNAAVHRT